MSAASYYNLTTVRPESVDVAIQRKAKISTMPDWPVLSVYYYADDRFKTGIETGCGPVLSVNGDLIEIAHYQTRESKWYRRSELWPSRFTKSGLRTCN